MSRSPALPECDYRVPVEGAGKFYCRHSRVHSADNLVTALSCMSCSQATALSDPSTSQLAITAPGPAGGRGGSTQFITSEQLMSDTRSLGARLPADLSGVAGIRAPTMLPACALGDVAAPPAVFGRPATRLGCIGHGSRLGPESKPEGPLLVIDDSVNGGYAIYQARQALA